MLKVHVLKYTPWRHAGGMLLYPHSLLTWTLDGDECSASPSGRFTPGMKLRYPLNRRLGGSRRRSELCDNESLAHLGYYIVKLCVEDMRSARQRVTYFTSRKSLVKYHLRHLRNCHASVTHCRLFTYRLLITNEQRQRDACRNLQGDIPCNYVTPTKFYLLWSHADIIVGELPSLIPRLLNMQAVEFCDCCGLGRIARKRP
jgi:hypothetical protein